MRMFGPFCRKLVVVLGAMLSLTSVAWAEHELDIVELLGGHVGPGSYTYEDFAAVPNSVTVLFEDTAIYGHTGEPTPRIDAVAPDGFHVVGPTGSAGNEARISFTFARPVAYIDIGFSWLSTNNGAHEQLTGFTVDGQPQNPLTRDLDGALVQSTSPTFVSPEANQPNAKGTIRLMGPGTTFSFALHNGTSSSGAGTVFHPIKYQTIAPTAVCGTPVEQTVDLVAMMGDMTGPGSYFHIDGATVGNSLLMQVNDSAVYTYNGEATPRLSDFGGYPHGIHFIAPLDKPATATLVFAAPVDYVEIGFRYLSANNSSDERLTRFQVDGIPQDPVVSNLQGSVVSSTSPTVVAASSGVGNGIGTFRLVGPARTFSFSLENFSTVSDGWGTVLQSITYKTFSPCVCE